MRQLLKITSIFALALVFTAGMAFGQNNEATIDQDDANNTATVNQVKNNNFADVTQSGDNTNTANIQQVIQDGNVARLIQDNGASAEIWTRGATVKGYDDAFAHQINTGEGSNTLNIASENNATTGLYEVDQLAGDNVIDIDRIGGTGNVHVRALQSSSSNNATIDLKDSPFVEVRQTGSGSHEATITTSRGGENGPENTVSVDQSGFDNATTVNQLGPNNTATVDQQ